MINSLFEWVGEIKFKRSPLSSFTEEEWSKWNTFMINRYLSMDRSNIDIVNNVQEINPKMIKEIYTTYKSLIPKKRSWSTYIKNSTKKTKDDKTEYVSKYYECSRREAKEYIEILSPEELKKIIKNFK